MLSILKGDMELKKEKKNHRKVLLEFVSMRPHLSVCQEKNIYSMLHILSRPTPDVKCHEITF